MIVPTSLSGVLVVVALVVPGIVWASVRTLLQGFKSPDRVAGERLTQAVYVSAVLDAFYLIAFGWLLVPLVSLGTRLVVQQPFEVGLVVLAFGVVIPAAAAYVAYGQVPVVNQARNSLRRLAPKWLVRLIPVSGFSSVPTAWDWAAPRKGGNWVRVLTAQGRWIGGWYSDDAFFSTFPEPRDLYLPEQWIMDEDGKFVNRAPNTAGIWLSLESAQLVEWTSPVSDATSSEEQ